MNDTKVTISLVYCIAFILILTFRKDENVIFSILGITILIALSLQKLNYLHVMLLTCLFGIVENVCVYYGLWKYDTKKQMPYVPLWIYLAWMASIIYIIIMTRH